MVLAHFERYQNASEYGNIENALFWSWKSAGHGLGHSSYSFLDIYSRSLQSLFILLVMNQLSEIQFGAYMPQDTIWTFSDDYLFRATYIRQKTSSTVTFCCIFLFMEHKLTTSQHKGESATPHIRFKAC